MTEASPFRLRTYGPRCASPPIYLCYELPESEPVSRSYSPTSSDGESGDECDESETESHSNSDSEDNSSADSVERNVDQVTELIKDVEVVTSDNNAPSQIDVVAQSPKPVEVVDPAEIPCPPSGDEADYDDDDDEKRRAEKREGKKKEVVDIEGQPTAITDKTPADNETEAPKRKQKKKKTKRRREEPPAPEVRPILTIRSSQGFVWNQDNFVPPYMKDRYIASTPPSSIPSRYTSPDSGKHNLKNNNFFSTSNQADFEVECVEIHVDEGELDGYFTRG